MGRGDGPVTARVVRVSGSLVELTRLDGAAMFDVVALGRRRAARRGGRHRRRAGHRAGLRGHRRPGPGRPGALPRPAGVGAARPGAARRRVRRAAPAAGHRRHLADPRVDAAPRGSAPLDVHAPRSPPGRTCRPATSSAPSTTADRCCCGCWSPRGAAVPSTGSPGRGVRRRGGRRDGRRGRRTAEPGVAGPPPAAVHRAAERADGAAHRAAGPGPALPGGAGQQRLGARRLRDRQDHAAPADRQVVRRGRHRLRRLRRARQRDGRRGRGAERADRPPHRRPAGPAHRGRRQHLEHADDGPRGEHLHRGDGGGVLPRHGLPRGADRGLHVAVGRGAAGVRVEVRGAAGRGGVPRRPGVGAGRVLRAGRSRHHARRPPRVGHDHRGGLPARRRPHRAGDRPHPAVRPVGVEPGPGPGLRPALPRGGLVGVVLPGRRGARGALRARGRPAVGAPPRAGARAARRGRPAGRAGRARRRSPRCRGPSGW